MFSLKRISCVLFVFVTMAFCIFPASSYAIAKVDRSSKLLIICDDALSLENSGISEFDGIYDILDSNDTDYSDIKGYAAYAVSSSALKTNEKLSSALRKTFNNQDSEFYIFGALTIKDYKDAFGIDEFGAFTDFYTASGAVEGKAFLSFSEDQESYSVENVISSSRSQTGNYIIASVATDNEYVSSELLIRVILKDYSSSLIQPMAIIVKSGYNYRSYFNEEYINMDFRLYRDMDETDPTYDYFAIVTNLSAYTDLSTWNSLSARHTLTYAVDEMLDFDPGDIYRAYSVSASVDMLSPTPSGTVSFDFEVGGGPTIAATYSSDSDYCDWSINQFWFFGQPLDGSLFKLGTSWASYATYAATDIKFRGTLIGPTGAGVNTAWKYVSVRYDYEEKSK